MAVKAKVGAEIAGNFQKAFGAGFYAVKMTVGAEKYVLIGKNKREKTGKFD